MTSTSPIADGEFFQLGYVTGDIARAMAEWQERYGVPGFFSFNTRDFAAPGAPGPFNRIALGYHGKVMVELIEPEADDPGIYRDALRSDGGTMLHHLGYMVDPDALEDMAARFQRQGVDVPVLKQENGLGLLYADTRQENGLFAEMVGRSEAMLAIFAHIPR